MRAGAVLLLALAGCVLDPTVDCGDHRCPAGKVCTATSCATPAEVVACRDLSDHAPCTTATIVTGACGEGACHELVCGDGIVDEPEMCDDGNVNPGDGCSILCNSDETCGNGVIDLVGGESCDDGSVGRSQDGCSSTCETELATWHDISPTAIGPRAFTAAAFDARRERIVVFGGATASDLTDETWEWDGKAWQRRFPPVAPAPRSGAVMIFDEARGQIVLFGGTTGSGYTNDTWTYDGTIWTQLSPAVSPPARGGMAFAYDSAKSLGILFGGTTSTQAFNDTWSWDGTRWVEPATAGAIPPPRAFHGMAYDPIRRMIVLTGGSNPVGAVTIELRDTWEWDGMMWVLRESGTSPNYQFSSMAFDGTRVILFGGLTDTVNGPAANGSMFQWTGSSWTVFNGNPQGRWGAALVWNRARLNTVLFGGRGGTFYDDTSTWDGSAWATPPMLPVSPPPRRNAALAFDSRRARAVLTGGLAATSFSDTWVLAEHQWNLMTSGGPPSASQIVYDSSRDRFVMFGGATRLETWELVNDVWTDATPAAPPPARQSFCLAYDSDRHRTILFGGTTPSTKLGETWEWNGAAWEQHVPASSPPARVGCAMTYDPLRKRTVMFGGQPTDDVVDDTWEWDGTTWSEVSPTVRPPGRAYATLVYDAQRLRTVLVGGQQDVIGFDDLWEWDGTAWTNRPIGSGPGRRFGVAAYYDTVGRQLVEVGGEIVSSGALRADTWALRYEAPLQANEACLLGGNDDDGDALAGCADPDCWARCASCGNGTCDPIEDPLLCPGDCP